MTTATAQSLLNEADDGVQRLRCMEIWGGISEEDAAISVPGIDAWVRARPAQGAHAGGDIHYVSTCGGGNIARFAVADVSGHGPSVEEVSAALRRQMRKHINTPRQTTLVRALSDEFGAVSEGGRFATGVFASYYAPTDELIVVNAGHPSPLLRRADTGQWGTIHDRSPDASQKFKDLPLGVIEGGEYSQFVVQLAPGDVALLYTDALIETPNPETGRLLGVDGLLDVVRSLDDGLSPVEIGPRLLERLEDFRDGPSDDDATLMTLHHNGASPPQLTLRDAATVMAKMLGLKKF